MTTPTTAECIELFEKMKAEYMRHHIWLTADDEVELALRAQLIELQVYKDCCDMGKCRSRYAAAQQMAEALDYLLTEAICNRMDGHGGGSSEDGAKQYFADEIKALTAWRETQ